MNKKTLPYRDGSGAFEDDYYNDLSQGTFAQVAFITPSIDVSEHPLYDVQVGQAKQQSLIGANELVHLVELRLPANLRRGCGATTLLTGVPPARPPHHATG